MPFRNLNPAHGRPPLGDQLRRLLVDRGLRRSQRPDDGPTAEVVTPDLAAIRQPRCSAQVTWLGHASTLIQLGERRILVDPVFSDRVGGFFPRLAALPLRPHQLPPVDVIAVTHNHYDHLDAASIAALPRSATVVVPLRLGRWFCRYGFARVIELNWWEETRLNDLRISCVPARHWSRRGLFDTNRSLWGGFVFSDEQSSIYHAGDTAWFDGFTEIGQRFPKLDAALLPIGGYAPQWFMRHNHFTPEQAGEACLQLQAQRLLPIHWGTFRLSDEPLREPIERLRDWWQTQSQLTASEPLEWKIGQTIGVNS